MLKKGTTSVGVQRQYSGTAGRSENCQIGVFLTYTTQAGHTLLERELYLPKRWTNDPKRSREADVPKQVSFATTPERAARMLWRTLDGGVKARWVLGDSVYGSHAGLRAALEARSPAYALAVACKERVEVDGKRKRVDQVAREVAAGDWQRLSAGAGSKGPRLCDWAWVAVAKPEREGWKRWLVIRRCLEAGTKPAEVAYFLVFAPTLPPLSEMVSAIGSRWTVEQCFAEAKGEGGLDEYEVRSFQGWYRHITLCMLAHAFLTVLRAHSQTQLPLWEESEENNRWGKSAGPLSVMGSRESCSRDLALAPTEKKRWNPFPSHAPSQTLSAFKRLRGLACPSSSL